MIKVFFRKCGETYKQQHQAAYELLYAAAAFCGYSVSPNQLKKTEKGKPYFENQDNLHFSISHSSEYAACVIGNIPCGIDIEKISSIPQKVSDRYLNGAAGIEALRRWTNRESYGKLTGEGFFLKTPIPDDIIFKNFEFDNIFVSVCTKANCNVFIYNTDFELIDL